MRVNTRLSSQHTHTQYNTHVTCTVQLETAGERFSSSHTHAYFTSLLLEEKKKNNNNKKIKEEGVIQNAALNPSTRHLFKSIIKVKMPPKALKRVSQESFDEVVQGNIDDFEMVSSM